MNYYLGCDPGWTNLAYCWIDENLNIITKGCLVPKDLLGAETPLIVDQAFKDEVTIATMKDEIRGAMFERFVYFQGVHNPNSEQILMVTGQMQFMMRDRYNVTPYMVRSFDWKSKLSKHLYKKGFRNPSDRLDKIFSVAAAEFIYNITFDTDHEADAACMAYMARMMDR